MCGKQTSMNEKKIFLETTNRCLNYDSVMQLNVTQALEIADMLHRETQSQPPTQWLIRGARDMFSGGVYLESVRP